MLCSDVHMLVDITVSNYKIVGYALRIMLAKLHISGP